MPESTWLRCLKFSLREIPSTRQMEEYHLRRILLLALFLHKRELG